MLFKQTAANEWKVLYNGEAPPSGSAVDVLVVELHVADASFINYTQWEHLQLESPYLLELPASTADGRLEADKAFKPTNTRKGIRSPFVIIQLHLTDEVYQAAQASPKEDVLYFHAPSKYWEYLFVNRDHKRLLTTSDLRLEDGNGKVEFSPFETVRKYDQEMLRTHSIRPIKMHERYDTLLSLALVSPDSHRSKQILRSNVSQPVWMMRHDEDNTDYLSMLCYF
jgi:hypothetical protein